MISINTTNNADDRDIANTSTATNNANNEESDTKNESVDIQHNHGIIKCYLRDNLHIASQSKLLSDGMSQTEVSRDQPLIMFVGSGKVKGKSSMLNRMYPNQRFNIFDNNGKGNALHSTMVDLIYMADYLDLGFHILDVHGKLLDPFFPLCTKSKITRINALMALASLTHGIVIQIHKDELSSKLSKKKQLKKPLEISGIYSKNTKDIVKFVALIDV